MTLVQVGDVSTRQESCTAYGATQAGQRFPAADNGRCSDLNAGTAGKACRHTPSSPGWQLHGRPAICCLIRTGGPSLQASRRCRLGSPAVLRDMDTEFFQPHITLLDQSSGNNELGKLCSQQAGGPLHAITEPNTVS